MTSQEVLKFVSQPVPRRVPRKVLLGMIDDVEYKVFFYALLGIAVPVFFLLLAIRDVLLYEWGRHSPFWGDLTLFAAIIYLVYKSFMLLFPRIRRAKRLLKEGLYTTGEIYRQESSFSSSQPPSFFDTINQRFMADAQYASGYAVSFTDRRGVRREASIIDIKSSLYSPMTLSDRPIGLLYLPDTEAVIVTDLMVSLPSSLDNTESSVDHNWSFDNSERIMENLKNTLREEGDTKLLSRLDEIERQLDEEQRVDRFINRFIAWFFIAGSVVIIVIVYAFFI